MTNKEEWINERPWTFESVKTLFKLKNPAIISESPEWEHFINLVLYVPDGQGYFKLL